MAVGEQILDAVAPIRARLLEGVRGDYYATDRELHILAAASRYCRECEKQGRESDAGECFEFVQKRLAEVGDQDSTPLVEKYVLPHIVKLIKRMDPAKQPQRERELYQYWLERGPTEE